MARHPFGGGTADFVSQPDNTGLVHVSRSTICTLYAAETGTSQITDLTDMSGNPISTVLADNYGSVPPFMGPPDDTSEMWISGGGPRRQRLTTSDLSARIKAIENNASNGGGGGDPLVFD